jgi:NRPS condensation-like uncharacterized protein
MPGWARYNQPPRDFLPATAGDRIGFAIDSVKRFPPFHIHAFLHFDGPLESPRLRKAVSRLLIRYPITRGILQIGVPFGLRSRWKILPHPPLDDIISRSEVRPISFPPDEENPSVMEFVNSRLDISIHPPIRILCLQNPSQSRLIIKSHHALVDGGGLISLLDELRRLYLDHSEENSGLAPRRENRGMFPLYLKAKIQYWPWILFRLFPMIWKSRMNPYQNPPVVSRSGERPDSNCGFRLRWRNLSFTPAETQTILEKARRSGVKVNDILLATAVRAFSRAGHNHSPARENPNILMAVNLRNVFDYPIMLANLSGIEIIPVPKSELVSFPQTLSWINSHTSRIKSRAPGLPYMLPLTLSRVLPYPLIKNYFQWISSQIQSPRHDRSGVTNIGVIDQSLSDWGKVKLDRLSILSPRIFPWGYTATVTTFNGSISINFGFLDHYVSPETVQQLSEDFRNEILAGIML